jgi:hypothetical protein
VFSRNIFFIAYGLTLLLLSAFLIDVEFVAVAFLTIVIFKLIAGGIKLLSERIYTEQRSLHGGNNVVIGVHKVVPSVSSHKRGYGTSNAATQILDRLS